MNKTFAQLLLSLQEAQEWHLLYKRDVSGKAICSSQPMLYSSVNTYA